MRSSDVVLIVFAGFVAAAAAADVGVQDLMHHRWVLESIDGDPLPEDGEGKGTTPELDFGEQMHVSGSLGCNRFNGRAVLRDGSFLIEAMVSTRMMCPPPFGEIELKVQTVLGSESSISLDDDKTLTLESADTVLVFRLEDWVR